MQKKGPRWVISRPFRRVKKESALPPLSGQSRVIVSAQQLYAIHRTSALLLKADSIHKVSFFDAATHYQFSEYRTSPVPLDPAHQRSLRSPDAVGDRGVPELTDLAISPLAPLGNRAQSFTIARASSCSRCQTAPCSRVTAAAIARSS